MKRFRITDNIVGLAVFLVAAWTYCSTVEPTASFWDCPEFITTAYKLEVGHPPGAPFFMLMANLFTQMAADASQVALMVNVFSALMSALCILFLFWSITHLTRKLIATGGRIEHAWQTVVCMAAGATGALAYTWSDTFWFSAVEGEVYASSSMFTALVFWLILKWEEQADEPHADRWLVLIFYLTGLSIGVHLLNLLCLPAITLVYYYKRNPEADLKGSLLAIVVSGVLVGAVLYGVVPGIVKVGGWFELFFVNWLGCPFNTGVVVYILVLIAVVLTAIWSTTTQNRRRTNILYLCSVGLLGIPFYGSGWTAFLLGIVVLAALYFALSYKKSSDGNYLMRKRLLNTSLLCMLMLMIGYSSYAVIVIRSTENPPMDQNSPEDIFTLGEYLSREQYGSRPLFYGEAYTSIGQAQMTGTLRLEDKTRWARKEKTEKGEPDSYIEVPGGYDIELPGQLKMLFPRIWSSSGSHPQAYEDWLGGVDKRNVTVQTSEGYSLPCQMPTQWANLRFFLSYQINFMYWRYFMWNFAGRQNDIQGNGEYEHGNWITGIPFIDNAMYGDQSLLPAPLRENKGHNVFYCLPLLLGLIGLFWQAYRGREGIQQFWVVFFLFFMTGLAIVLYINQSPQQVRERDYAYAGSFYAFAMWIGLGVAAVAEGLRRFVRKPMAAACLSLVCLLVPLQMVSQTWDDHDRSHRYACRDFGLNYLNTLPDEGNPIIFTNGDNDTFPLWYAQETEGRRTDARVCNESYLQTDWYTDQMVRPAYDSPALPIAWDRSEYVDDGQHNFYAIKPEMKAELDALKQTELEADPYDLEFIMDNYVRKHHVFPTDSVVLRVDADQIRRSGMYVPEGEDIPEYISISLREPYEKRGGLYRADVMIYEMLARNHWQRPMFMSTTLGRGNYAYLENYLVLEGLAYRLTPFKTGMNALDTDKMYRNMMSRFAYGNMSQRGVYVDETIMRMCLTHRRMFMLLAQRLLDEGRRDKALAVLRKCRKELPDYNIPFDDADYDLALLWAACGDRKEAARVARAAATYALDMLRYLSSLGAERLQPYTGKCNRYFTSALHAIQVLDEADKAQGEAAQRELQAIMQLPAGQIGFSAYESRRRQYMQGLDNADAADDYYYED